MPDPTKAHGLLAVSAGRAVASAARANGLSPESGKERDSKLNAADDLRPSCVADRTASSMLVAGFTWDAISDVREWRLADDACFKRRAPGDGDEARAVTSAVRLLDAFGVDASTAKVALGQLDSPEG